MKESHEVGAYRIAVGSVGLALIVALAGICTIVAVGRGTDIPAELWTLTSALGGGLLGLLAPTPSSPSKEEKKSETQPKGLGKVWRAVRLPFKDLWANRSVLLLLLIFIVSIVLGAAENSDPFKALAGASGAALLGLLAPGNDGKQGVAEN